MNEKTVFIIILTALIYSSINVACDPLAFRLVSLFNFTIAASALLYCLRYPLLDFLAQISGRKFVFWLIIGFHISDLIFDLLLYFINILPAPKDFDVSPFNVIFPHLPKLFFSDFMGSMIAGIAEVTIFSILQKKLKVFSFRQFSPQ